MATLLFEKAKNYQQRQTTIVDVPTFQTKEKPFMSPSQFNELNKVLNPERGDDFYDEVEVSFGRFGDNRFKPGVLKRQFFLLLQYLQREAQLNYNIITK